MRFLRIAALLALTTLCLHTDAQAPSGLTGSFRIAGKIVNSATGAPVPKATVSILNEDNSQIVASVLSADDGSFQFDRVPAGKYPLTASKRGFLTEFFEQHDELSTAIVTGPDQATEHLVFRLDPQAILRGVISSSDGDPVDGANVMLFRKSGSKNEPTVAGSTRTDDTGAYEFTNLEPGQYFVATSAEPWYAIHSRQRQNDNNGSIPLDVAYPITFYDSATDETAATPVGIAAGESVETNITLHALPAIHITLHQPAGQTSAPTAAAEQVVFGLPMPVGDLDNAGLPRGSVQVVGIAPGHYRITQGSPARTLDLNAASDTEIDSNTGTPAVSVIGILRDSTGLPLPDITLVLEPAGATRDQMPIPSVSQGVKFHFDNVPPGTWTLTANAAQNGAFTPHVIAVSSNGIPASGGLIEISDHPLQIVATLSRTQCTIRGFARRQDNPAPAVMIVLVPRDAKVPESWFRRDQSDSDGSFALRDVPPGQYTVIAIEDGWKLNWRNYQDIARFLPRGVNVNVTEHSEAAFQLPHPVQAQAR